MNNLIEKQPKINRDLGKPIYIQLAEILLQDIVVNKKKEGEIVTSENHLSRAHNLNRITVRHAVSHLINIGILSRLPGKGIYLSNYKKAYEELSKITAQKNEFVTPSRGRKVKANIGLVVFDETYIHCPFTSNVLEGISSVIEKHKYSLFTYAIKGNIISREQNTAIQDMVFRNRISGLLLMVQQMSPEEIIALKKQIKIPVVLIKRSFPEENLTYVHFDVEKGIYQGVEHLIKLGHRKIAFVDGPEKLPICREELKGYQSTLRKHGIEYSQSLVRMGDFSIESGFQLTRELFEDDNDFTAIQCGDDHIAIGAMKAIEEKDLKVPSDISVVGFNDMPAAVLSHPQLTTVCVPSFEMGRLAMEKLRDCTLSKKKIAERIILKTKLIVRESSDVRK